MIIWMTWYGRKYYSPIRKELGWRTALSLAGKQATSSLAVAAIISLIFT